MAKRNFISDDRGMAAVEFAIVAPILLTLIFGIFQLGVLFYANAGLTEGVNEGARYATIFPSPSDDQIKKRVLEKTFGLDRSLIEGPTVRRGLSDGVSYVDVSMKYRAPLGFAFISLPAVTFTAERRSYQ